MKKIIFGILTFLGIGLSFCSATDYSGNSFSCWVSVSVDGYNACDDDYLYFNSSFPYGDYKVVATSDFGFNAYIGLLGSADSNIDYYYSNTNPYSFSYDDTVNGVNIRFYTLSNGGGGLITFDVLPVGGSSIGNENTGSISTIDVYYNNGNSTETITCDGTQAISINGLSTITSTNTFTPYYNISYTDEDNQKLTESYSKDILYLSGGLFKKTYTGDNERILTDTIDSPNSVFSGYLPTFEITGGIEEVTESGNIFYNFAENSLKFTLSNIPSYIQYVILLMLLFFILGFIRKFRRK